MPSQAPFLHQQIFSLPLSQSPSESFAKKKVTQHLCVIYLHPFTQGPEEEKPNEWWGFLHLVFRINWSYLCISNNLYADCLFVPAAHYAMSWGLHNAVPALKGFIIIQVSLPAKNSLNDLSLIFTKLKNMPMHKELLIW